MEAPKNKIPKRPLMLPFMNRLDAWLLKNYPDIWSARTHLVLYFSALMYLVLFLFCVVMPDDARTRSHFEFWGTAAFLLAFVGLIFWLIYLFRFNVFKRYGALMPGDRLRTFLTYFVTVYVLALFIFVPLFAEKMKADSEYTDDELVQDANDINYYIGLLEKDDFPVVVSPDTLVLTSTNDEAILKNSMYNHSYGFHYIDSSEVHWQLNNADSVQPLGDSAFVLFSYTNMRFVSPGHSEMYAHIPTLTSVQLYYMIYRNKPTIGATQARVRLNALLDKYYHQANYNSYSSGWNYSSPDQDNINYDSYLREHYNIGSVDEGLRHIAQRKHPLDFNDSGLIFLVIAYVSLGLTLLLFAFRHCSIKTFFLTLLAGIVLVILTGLVIAIVNIGHDDLPFYGFLLWMMVYYLIFIGIAATISRSRKRSLVKGIALNLALFMTFTLPIMSVAAYYDRLRQFYRYSEMAYSQYEYLFNNEMYHYTLAQIGGAVFLLVMLELVFRKWYRAWYAQPEE